MDNKLNLENLSTEELLARLDEMQKMLKEKSKNITVLKNQVKKDAAPKAPVMVNYSLSNKELTEMSDYIREELVKLGTMDKHFFPEESWQFLRELWHDYATKSKNITYDLSQLWARINKLGLGDRFKSYTGFKEFLAA